MPLVVWRKVGRTGRQICDFGIERHCLELLPN
ncbi:hypothetical protein GGD67_002910 [Bradyrhizobium sp. IAR9]|nr:hypothetical protein [Bradyrhizobium sp. IAR9]